MELNKIQSSGSWGKATDDLNQNFSKVNNAVEQVKNATTRNKGYFSSDTELKSAFPSANVGDIAYVGSAYPYQTWAWDGSAWKKKNDAGGEESVNLGDYYTKEETNEKLAETDEKLSELGSQTGEWIFAPFNNIKAPIIISEDGVVEIKKGNGFSFRNTATLLIFSFEAEQDLVFDLKVNPYLVYNFTTKNLEAKPVESKTMNDLLILSYSTRTNLYMGGIYYRYIQAEKNDMNSKSVELLDNKIYDICYSKNVTFNSLNSLTLTTLTVKRFGEDEARTIYVSDDESEKTFILNGTYGRILILDSDNTVKIVTNSKQIPTNAIVLLCIDDSMTFKAGALFGQYILSQSGPFVANINEGKVAIDGNKVIFNNATIRVYNTSNGYNFAITKNLTAEYELTSDASLLVYSPSSKSLELKSYDTFVIGDIILFAYSLYNKIVYGGVLSDFLDRESVDVLQNGVYKSLYSRDISFFQNKVSLKSINIKRFDGDAAIVVYANEDQTEKTFEFKVGEALHLVLTKDNTITTRKTTGSVLKTDIILLSYDIVLSKFVEGALLLQEVNSKINRSVYVNEVVDLDTTRVEKRYINASNNWGGMNPINDSYIIDISFAKEIEIKAGENTCTYSILNTYKPEYGERPDFAKRYTSRRQISAGEIAAILVDGDDENWLIVYRTGNNYVSYSPEYIYMKSYVSDIVSKYISSLNDSGVISQLEKKIVALQNSIPKPINQEGRDIPQNTGAYNAYRRALQLKNVDWTALYDVPNNHGDYTYKAGVKKGIPYSSVKEHDKFVGYNVSILTFVTAANNPYSLLYTENVNAETSRSAYGITYHGVNCGAYFGIVCSIYASYAIGMDVRTSSFEWQWLEKEGIFEKIFEQEANGIMIGDVIWEPGHCNIIIDIYRDERGRISKIYWSESAGSTPKTSIYNADEFNARIKNKGDIIYRYKDLYKNIEYTPSQFSLVDDEVAEEYVFNDDICTFAGDYAAFREGELIVINYTKGGLYESLNIYSGDTLLRTLALDSNSEVHSIDISSLNLPAGKYKATLVGSSESSPTFFEVIETNVSVEGNRNSAKVSFASANAKPMQIEIADGTGYPWGTQALSDFERSNGYINLDIVKFADEHRPDVALPDICYVKITFKGDYGSVTNGYNVTI